jgi:hypothetical protein
VLDVALGVVSALKVEYASLELAICQHLAEIRAGSWASLLARIVDAPPTTVV